MRQVREMSEGESHPGEAEEQARALLRRVLPSGWPVEELPGDAYLDVRVTLTAPDQPVTGEGAAPRFAIMIRGVSVLRRRHGFVRQKVAVEALEHAAAWADPVMLLVYDIPGDVGYWRWLKPWIAEARDARWEALKAVTVPLPETSIFDARAVPRIVADLEADESALSGWAYAEEPPPTVAGAVGEDEAMRPAEAAAPAVAAAEKAPPGELLEPPVEEFPDAAVPSGNTGEAADVRAGPPPATFRLHAPLRVVEATNFLRYGPDGVRRYGRPPQESASSSATAATLRASFAWQDANGHDVLVIEDIALRQAKADDRAAVWTAYVPAYGLSMAWVWDFYRVLSVVYWQFWVGSPPTPGQTAFREALQTLASGDGLRLRAALPTGVIDQWHPVTAEFLAALARDLEARAALGGDDDG